MRTLIFTISLLSLLATVNAQVNEDGIIAEMYDLELSVYPTDSYLKGCARITITGLSNDTLAYYLHGELRTDSVFLDNVKLDFNQGRQYYYYNYSLTANKTIAAIDETRIDNTVEEHTLKVYYSGFFHPSFSRGQSDFMKIDQTGAWLRSYGYSLWFPVFLDDGSESYNVEFKRVSVNIPEDYSCILSGEHVKDYAEGSRKISVWSPGNLNLIDMQLVCSVYKIISRQNVYVYCFDDSASKANSSDILDYAVRLKLFFENNIKHEETGRSLHITEMPEYGDISSGNATGIQMGRWQNFIHEEGPKITLAHEMVHEYVHVGVSWDDPLIAIVTEGFPVYYNLLAIAEVSDPDFYQEAMNRTERSYIYKRETGLYSAERKIKLPKEVPLASIKFDEIGVYKDRFVLSDRIILFMNYLRTEMGKNNFSGFTTEIFSMKEITYQLFLEKIYKYLPGSESDIRLWLETTEYPGRLMLDNL